MDRTSLEDGSEVRHARLGKEGDFLYTRAFIYSQASFHSSDAPSLGA